MVTGRLLRLLFTSEHAPDLSVLDACVVSIDESLGTVRVSLCVRVCE